MKHRSSGTKKAQSHLKKACMHNEKASKHHEAAIKALEKSEDVGKSLRKHEKEDKKLYSKVDKIEKKVRGRPKKMK